MFLPKNIMVGVFGLVSALWLCGCRANHPEGIVRATVSIPPQEWLLEQIGGERVKINCLLKPGADPENQEPSMRQLMELYDSQIYFTLGGLPFEEATIERTRENMPDLQICNASEGIKLIADECHGHHHEDAEEHEEEGFDPHIWTSVSNCRTMADNMERALEKIDPSGKEVYRLRLQRLDSLLNTTDDSIRAMLSGCADRCFMTWHPSMGYFARDYRLVQLSVQQEGKEVTPLQLASAIERAREEKPAVLFYDIAQQGNETGLLRDDLGLETYGLKLMERDFLPQLVNAAKAIRENCKRQ